MTKFERGVADPFNNALGARRQMNGLAATIVGRILARDPALVFQPMQQRNKRRLFNSKMGSDLSLGQGARRDGQVHQGAPFRLTQTHRFEAFIQLQAPSPGGSVQERTENIYVVRFHRAKIVSLLTNSNSVALSMPAPYSILSSKIDSFR